MKRTFQTSLLVLLLTNFLQAQDFICGTASLSISDITCNDQGTINPDDDIITFVLTGVNNSNDSIFNLPLGSQIEPDPGTRFFIPNHAILTFGLSYGTILVNGAGTWLITMPSPGCASVDLMIALADVNEPNCSGLRSNLLINPIDGNAVPTMGEWGLLVLFLLTSISFVIAIKQENYQYEY